MNIEWQDIARVAVGAVPAVVAVVGLTRGPGSLRSTLNHDIAALKDLPPDSAAHGRLLLLIEREVDRLAKWETESTRDISGVILGVILTVALGALGLALLGYDGWYWHLAAVPVFFVAAVGLYGMFESIQRVPRNEKGHRL